MSSPIENFVVGAVSPAIDILSVANNDAGVLDAQSGTPSAPHQANTYSGKATSKEKCYQIIPGGNFPEIETDVNRELTGFANQLEEQGLVIQDLREENAQLFRRNLELESKLASLEERMEIQTEKIKEGKARCVVENKAHAQLLKRLSSLEEQVEETEQRLARNKKAADGNLSLIQEYLQDDDKKMKKLQTAISELQKLTSSKGSEAEVPAQADATSAEQVYDTSSSNDSEPVEEYDYLHEAMCPPGNPLLGFGGPFGIMEIVRPESSLMSWPSHEDAADETWSQTWVHSPEDGVSGSSCAEGTDLNEQLNVSAQKLNAKAEDGGDVLEGEAGQTLPHLGLRIQAGNVCISVSENAVAVTLLMSIIALGVGRLFG